MLDFSLGKTIVVVLANGYQRNLICLSNFFFNNLRPRPLQIQIFLKPHIYFTNEPSVHTKPVNHRNCIFFKTDQGAIHTNPGIKKSMRFKKCPDWSGAERRHHVKIQNEIVSKNAFVECSTMNSAHSSGSQRLRKHFPLPTKSDVHKLICAIYFIHSSEECKFIYSCCLFFLLQYANCCMRRSVREYGIRSDKCNQFSLKTLNPRCSFYNFREINIIKGLFTGRLGTQDSWGNMWWVTPPIM